MSAVEHHLIDQLILPETWQEILRHHNYTKHGLSNVKPAAKDKLFLELSCYCT